MEPEKDIFEQWEEERKSRSWIVRKYNWLVMWFKQEGRYIPKETIRSIKKLWYWFPIIWKDRNWDSHFIFNMFEHKLKAQSKYLKEKGIYIGSERDAEIIMTCVRLIGRVRDEYYAMEYMKYFKEKHWFEPIEYEGNSLWKSRVVSERFDEYFAKYPLIYKRVMNGEGPINIEGREDDKKIIAMNIAHMNHDRARKLLFKLMEENIERWSN